MFMVYSLLLCPPPMANSKEHLRDLPKELERIADYEVDGLDKRHSALPMPTWKERSRACHKKRMDCSKCKAHAQQIWRELRIRLAERAMRQARAEQAAVTLCTDRPAHEQLAMCTSWACRKF